MTFNSMDQDFLRAIVREEIALDEARRLKTPTSPTTKPVNPTERAGAGAHPTAPAPTNIANTVNFVAELLRAERDRRCDIEAVTVRKRARGQEIRLIAGGRSFTLTVAETAVMA